MSDLKTKYLKIACNFLAAIVVLLFIICLLPR